MKVKYLLFILFTFWLNNTIFADTFPRDQVIVAGEYFLNKDPGEGNGIPINGLYNYATANVDFSLNVPENTVIYVRFKSSNGQWSAPRPILYKNPLPNKGATLVSAEYFINNDPGIGKGVPVSMDYQGNINFKIDHLNENDVVYLRVKDSYGRWSSARMIQYHKTYMNRGASLVSAEYFINHDPGIGNGIPLKVDNYGNVEIPKLTLNRNDRFYLRFKDSYGRWGPAKYFEYQYQDIIAAEYKLKYKSGSVSNIKRMTIQPHTDPTLAFYTALSDEIISSSDDIDTLIIRLRTNDILGHWQKFKWSEIPVTGIFANYNLPTEFKLYHNFPNPFNPTTTIKYDLPKFANVKIEVFNFLGQKIKTLVNKPQSPGRYVVKWDGKNEEGIKVASGIYFYKIKAGKFESAKRMILLK